MQEDSTVTERDQIETRVELTEDQLRELLDGRRDSIRVPDSGTQANTTPIANVELDREYNLVGIVSDIDDINEFQRNDGDTGQVRNIRIQDRTGALRVALWGEKADKKLSVGDTVHVTNVEIQDGYQDTFEGSVGWNSMLNVVQEPDDPLYWVTVVNSGPEESEPEPDEIPQ